MSMRSRGWRARPGRPVVVALVIALSVRAAAAAASGDQPAAQPSLTDGADDHRPPRATYLAALADALAEAGGGATNAPGSRRIAEASVTYEGGDGSTIEGAIVIKGINSDVQGTMAELAFVRGHIDDCRLVQQGLIGRAGHHYDAIKCRTSDGVVHTFFFDITEYFGKQ
jgi:hypothetical protein